MKPLYLVTILIALKKNVNNLPDTWGKDVSAKYASQLNKTLILKEIDKTILRLRKEEGL